jgi:hypothetical protein
MIKSSDIYWLAGILEGEGCFLYDTSARIQLKMTDEDVIVKSRDLMSPNSKIRIGIQKNTNHKTSYSFCIQGNLAIQWLMTLYSLMGRRRKERFREIFINWHNQQRRDKGVDVCLKGHIIEQLNNPQNRCKICDTEANRKYKETYDRPSRVSNETIIKNLMLGLNISKERAIEILLETGKIKEIH